MKAIIEKYKNHLIIAGALLFIALNLVFTFFEIYYLNLLPFVLIFAYIGLTRLDTLLLITVFLIPVSVPLREISPGLGFDFYLPTEPLLFAVMLLFVYRLIISEKHRIDKDIINHPVSLIIYFYLFWMLITTITSTMPLISFKALISKIWFIIPFYFIGSQMFTKTGNIKKFMWSYILTFFIIIVYSTVKHVNMGIGDKDVANFVMQPFYNDHTAYGAMLAMFLPVLVGLSQLKKGSLTFNVFIWIIIFVFVVGLVLSYSRAAWLSVLSALAVFLVLRFKIKFGIVFIAILGGLLYLYSQRSAIILELEQNRQDSSEKLAEHVQSISNISTDASNVERINRWKCAIKMWAEKPVFGWGPGTYQFQYAPFQMSYDKTIISTNSGNRGNAHSEYIGPLAESGILGSLSVLLLVLYTLLTGFRVYFNAKEKEIKSLSLTILLGLITYYIHGTLNNFLDTDKASAPFWAFTVMLVVMDVYQKKQTATQKTPSPE